MGNEPGRLALSVTDCALREVLSMLGISVFQDFYNYYYVCERGCMCATACGGQRATFRSQFAPSTEGSGIDQVTRLVRPWALQSSLEGINDACASDTQYPF